MSVRAAGRRLSSGGLEGWKGDRGREGAGKGNRRDGTWNGVDGLTKRDRGGNGGEKEKKLDIWKLELSERDE